MEKTNLQQYAENLSDSDLRMLVTDIRLSFPNLTQELKEEWRECIKYCTQRRKQNWDNRKIGSGAQGVSGGGVRQEQMRLPRLAEIQIEKNYGPDWRTDKKAHDWAWKTFPQFRLIEKR